MQFTNGQETTAPDSVLLKILSSSVDTMLLFEWAWKLMRISEKMDFLQQPEVIRSLMKGGITFAQDLHDELTAYLLDIESTVATNGFDFYEGEQGFYWEFEAEGQEGLASESFAKRSDAVLSAFEQWKTLQMQ